MPRAYTAQEAASIRRRLLDAARERFVREGLAGTTVAELTADVGIGKGSLYLFFGSKEELFFAVQEEVETEVKEAMRVELDALEGDPEALLAHLFTLQARLLDEHPFVRLVTDPEVIAALQAKVPPAVLADHQASDRAFWTGLMRRWIERGVLPRTTDPELVFATSAALFALSLQRAIVGPRYPDVVAVIVRGLAAELSRDGGTPASTP